MALTTAAKNTALDALTFNKMSLHTGDPSEAGTANEVTGNGYARQTVAFSAAANGTRSLNGTLQFDAGAGTYTHYALWNNTTCVSYAALSASVTLSATGKVEIGSGSLSLT